MSRFSEDQKKIAVLLYESSLSVDELNEKSGIPFDRLNAALKEMLRLGLVNVSGYPQRYSLSEKVAEGVRRRKEIQEKDPFDIRIKAIIEVKGVEESFIKKHMLEIEDNLRKSKAFTIYDVYKAEPIVDGSHLSSYLEVNMSVKDFTSLVKFMYFFGPTSVEVLKPARIVLAMDDLQDALMEMAEMIQAYNHELLKSMSKAELEDFARQLYAPTNPNSNPNNEN